MTDEQPKPKQKLPIVRKPTNPVMAKPMRRPPAEAEIEKIASMSPDAAASADAPVVEEQRGPQPEMVASSWPTPAPQPEPVVAPAVRVETPVPRTRPVGPATPQPVRPIVANVEPDPQPVEHVEPEPQPVEAEATPAAPDLQPVMMEPEPVQPEPEPVAPQAPAVAAEAEESVAAPAYPATVREMLRRVDPAWESFRAMAGRFPSERMDEHLSEDGWTRKQMLAHIAAWHDLTADRLIKLFNGGKPVALDRDIDAINAGVARQAIGKTAGEVLKDMEATFNRLRRQMQRLTDQQLRGFEWWAAQIIAGNTYEHYEEHWADVYIPEPPPGSQARR